MARPTLDAAPTADELAAVTCPVERYATISRLARTWGTLPHWLATIRRDALVEAIADGHTATSIAARADVSLGRVSQLFKLTKTTAAGQES